MASSPTVGDDQVQYLQLDYTKFIPSIIGAIQELSGKLTDLATTVASFADRFTTRELHFTRAAGEDLTVEHFRADKTATDQLCLTDGPNDPNPVCVTKPQLAARLSQSAAADLANPSPTSTPPTNTDVASPTPDPTDDTSTGTTPTEPPTIEIDGNNPAYIQVGDRYNDLGARIMGPTQADTNLGIKTFLNGALVSNIVLDTTATSTSAQ